MRTQETWSQDLVLSAMCKHIEQLQDRPDFILVTGDIAFSGRKEEYILAEQFLNEISQTSNVPKEKIYCIPGNHDIDRDRQRLCFYGARLHLTDQNKVDQVLNNSEDLETILAREKNYREFQRTFFAGQAKSPTKDSLGYVSQLSVDGIEISIVGLDSAWLAEGGTADHGKLLIGERQTVNAIKIVEEEGNSNVVIGLAHHPLHLLQEFDRRPIQN